MTRRTEETVSGPILGTAVFFVLQQLLADLGAVYLIVLGVVALAVMLKAPGGLWRLVPTRWSQWFFPIQLRVRAVELDAERPHRRRMVQ